MEGRNVKINLDYYKKNHIIWVLTGAFILFIVCVIVAATAAPNIFGGKTLDYNTCKSSEDNFCFSEYISDNHAYFKVDLSPANQIFYLQLDFDSKADIDKEIKYDLFISYSYDFNSYLYLINNKTIRIKCTDGECDSEILLYMPYISHNSYNVDLRFYGSITVDSMNFKIRYFSKQFIQFFMITKYFFLALSILAIAHFFFHLYAIKLNFWSLESKLSGFMLLSLFIFNEPLLYYTINKAKQSWAAVSIFCNSQFLAFILLFWFQILKNGLKPITKIILTLFESLIVCSFIILMSLMYRITVKEQKKDPTFSWESDLPTIGRRIYISGLILLIILAIIMAAQIVFSIKNVLPSIKNKDKSETNRIIILFFIYFMIFISFLLIGIGSFQPVPRGGTLLMTSVSFFNILFILLSWLYTPSWRAYIEFLNSKNANEGIEAPTPKNHDNSMKNQSIEIIKILNSDFECLDRTLDITRFK